MGVPRPAAGRLPSRQPNAPVPLPSRRGGCASSRLDHGFQTPSKTTKSAITRQICIQKINSTSENELQGQAQALNMVLGAQRRQKKIKIKVLLPAGAINTRRNNGNLDVPSLLKFSSQLKYVCVLQSQIRKSKLQQLVIFSTMVLALAG